MKLAAAIACHIPTPASRDHPVATPGPTAVASVRCFPCGNIPSIARQRAYTTEAFRETSRFLGGSAPSARRSPAMHWNFKSLVLPNTSHDVRL
jgi:hypothetical protein